MDIDPESKMAAVMVAGAGLVASVIWTVRKGLVRVISAKFDGWAESLEKKQQTYSMDAREELRQLARLEMKVLKSADSFLHLTGKNGIDCLPIPGHQYTVKTYDGFEIDAEGRIFELDQYSQDLTVDEQYRDMIREIVDPDKVGYVWLDIDTMPDCLLKAWYAKEGVLCSLIYFVKREVNLTTNHLHYISMRWKTEKPTDVQKGQALLVAARIKQKIRRVF